MTKEEKLIKTIKLEFDSEKNTKSYERVKRMAKTLSNNLYSEDSHFIYELIQNAQDNEYIDGVLPTLEFYIFENGILTKNNEIGFSEVNIKALCDFNDSPKSKNKALGFIGEKGIGFKSVFAITDTPLIHSNGYRFYFKEGEYIEPYWIESFDNFPLEFQDVATTNIYLPYSSKFENQKDIENKLDDIEPILILFLNKLKQIKIYKNQNLQFSVIKKDLPNNVVSIENNNKNLEFKIFSKVINCIETIKEEKRENVLKRELFLAFPLQAISDTRIFAFLPTEIETGLPFLIQADFLLNASRSEIERNKEWNKWILDEIVSFFIETFHHLQDVDKYNYLFYIDKEKSTNKFIDTYYQQILQKLQYKRLFLTTDEQYKKSSNIAILEYFDFMFEYLKDIKYTNQNKERYSYLNNKFYIPKHIIKNWNITKINKKEFLRIIGNCNKFFAQKFENDNLLFEKLLDYIGTEYKDKEILDALPIIPIDENNEIKFYSKNELINIQIFFNLDDEGILNNVFPDLKIISKKYKEELEKIDFFSSIFEIKQPDISQILSSISDDFFSNIENNLTFLVYIKNNYKHNENIIIDLLAQKYKFLTKNNNLIKHVYQGHYNNQPTFSTKLYISQEYLDVDNSIEQIVEKYCDDTGKKKVYFITDKYLEKEKQTSAKKEDELKKEWRDFFGKLKVNDAIKFEEFQLKMWAYDSKHCEKETSIDVYNIPFLTTPFFDYFNKAKLYDTHLNLNNLTRQDSIFLYKLMLKLEIQIDTYLWADNEFKYGRVQGFYREFEYTQTKTPWKSFIESDFPIYTDDKQHFKIKEFYLTVDEKLNKFFRVLPQDYKISNQEQVNIIFNVKNEPEFDDVLNLVKDKKFNNFEDIKTIFEYLHYKFKDKKLDFDVVPILKKEKIEFISKEKLIWEDGKELGLTEIKTSYGDDFKRFFIDQIGIVEKPTIGQFINHLKTNPKNYWSVFYKFISLLSQNIKVNENISNEKIVLIKNTFYSLREIIFNDEFLENCTHIENLLTIEKKYYSHFKNIIEAFNIQQLSSFNREYILCNRKDNDEIIDIYLKLLNFTWDYIFSKDDKRFGEIKGDSNFILETKSIFFSAYADIILRLDVNGQNIDVEKNLAIQNGILYIATKINRKHLVKEISKYIAEKIEKVTFEILERFYDKVYTYNEFTIDEYYKDEEINSPEKEEDMFDFVCENIKYKNSSSKEEDGDELKDYKTECINKIDNNTRIENQNQKSFPLQNNNSLPSDKPIEKSDQTICPECNVLLSSKNLKKHLCKVHHKNCDENNENRNNNQNNQYPIIPDLMNAICKHNKDIQKKDEFINPSIVLEEKKFIKKATEKLKESLMRLSNQDQNRYRKLKIYAGEDKTKEFLKQQYEGHCQICGFTFDKKENQGKYFERFSWLSEKITKQKTNFVEAGSSLCLCSKCHSILKFGDFESKFITNLVNSNLKISTFKFNEFCDVSAKNTEGVAIPSSYDFIEMDMYKLPIRILNEDRAIFYTEEHFLLFFNMLIMGESSQQLNI